TALNQCLKENPVGYSASMTGRFYAMDRDKRWDRIEPVYRLLTEGIEDVPNPSAEEVLTAYYEKGIYDEFIPPTQLHKATIKTGDSIFFFNFRADRARELSEAFLKDSFDGFHRQHRPQLHSFCTMTDYSDTLKTEVLFKPLVLKNTLGELLSNAGLTQLRIAETEKYAHVTFFFNGGSEETHPGEKRILIPSPHVKTYDLKPEMSAPELTNVLVKAIQDNTYDVIICNYANADMVGHTGDMKATIQAIECLDTCLKAIGDAIQSKNGHLLITADHGNAECMFNETSNQPQTAHTNEPVPFLYIGPDMKQLQQNHGNLSDVAPTILDLLGLRKPPEMTGHSLFIKSSLDQA
ncbi:MAG: 2,3-bisphosphoglycerate-independent phosphoglycerate mutase, partial [Legionellaceae bacterium]